MTALADAALAIAGFDLETDHPALYRDTRAVVRTVAPTADAAR